MNFSAWSTGSMTLSSLMISFFLIDWSKISRSTVRLRDGEMFSLMKVFKLSYAPCVTWVESTKKTTSLIKSFWSLMLIIAVFARSIYSSNFRYFPLRLSMSKAIKPNALASMIADITWKIALKATWAVPEGKTSLMPSIIAEWYIPIHHLWRSSVSHK